MYNPQGKGLAHRACFGTCVNAFEDAVARLPDGYSTGYLAGLGLRPIPFSMSSKIHGYMNGSTRPLLDAATFFAELIRPPTLWPNRTLRQIPYHVYRWIGEQESAATTLRLHDLGPSFSATELPWLV